MPSISATVVLAEGFSVRRGEISLDALFHWYLWDEELAGMPRQFFVYVAAFGLPKGGPHTATVDITMEDEEGVRSLFKGQGPFFSSLVPNAGIALVGVEGLILPKPARYTVNVIIGGELVSQEPLFVVAPEEP